MRTQVAEPRHRRSVSPPDPPQSVNPVKRNGRAASLIIVAGFLSLMALGFLATRSSGERLEQTAAQASTLAAQVKAECDVGALTGPICAEAAQVESQPIPGPEGPRGPAGPAGPRGSPGDPGLTGPTGEQGTAGTPGISGSPGLDGSNGGEGPEGPEGPEGVPGRDGSPAESYSMQFSDGSTQVCVRDPDSPDRSPSYLCEERTVAPTAPSTPTFPLIESDSVPGP